jgi:L-lactate dehydrogenase complex protein LldG
LMKGCDPTRERLIATFTEEARACGAGVVRVPRAKVAAAVAILLEDAGLAALTATLEGLGQELRDRGVETVIEGPGELPMSIVSRAGAGVGTALAGVATSGSILIGPGSGAEGLVSILPPHYVALLDASCIEPDLAAAFAAFAPLIGQPGTRFALVTGPSRTSDIELTPVIGVHGPLRLDVVIVDA